MSNLSKKTQKKKKSSSYKNGNKTGKQTHIKQKHKEKGKTTTNAIV